MNYNLKEFDLLVDVGYLRKAETNDLVLYTYTDLCQYESMWTPLTTIARGLILKKSTGEVIAKPFPKFFNLGERIETRIENLPNLPYKVTEKMDGSLGIVYYYNNVWNVATKGSFTSDQAIKALQILKQYNLSGVDKNLTLLVEIIYPENKIVVSYNEEKLVLLSAFNKNTQEEINNLKEISEQTNMPLVNEYLLNINEMIELQKTLPKDKEGFVVRYDNGLRIKIKGDEYLRIHKIISCLSPLSFWEVLENGKVPTSYLIQIPEEFKNDYEPIVHLLESKYFKIKNEIHDEFNKLPIKEITKEARKEIGLFLPNSNFKHKSIMFSKLLNQTENVDKYIKQQIKPVGNVLTE